MKLLLALVLLLQQSPHRVVTLYSASDKDPVYREQMRLLNLYPKRLKERDMVMVTKHRKGKFMVTLTGKDGLEKFRAYRAVTAPELFVIVDSMPMRQREMKKKQ